MSMIRKGKPDESQGRKAMGLRSLADYDCQAAEDRRAIR
jgi:hypothetical protein